MHLFYSQGVLACLPDGLVIGIVGLRLILGHSRYQLFKLATSYFYFHEVFPYNCMSCFYIGLQVATCSFLDAPFFTAKVFWGGSYKLV